jgi:hypothetical protein
VSSRKPIKADGQCTSRFAGCRCDLKSGHPGPHHHDGAKGTFGWGGRHRKRSVRGGHPPIRV